MEGAGVDADSVGEEFHMVCDAVAVDYDGAVVVFALSGWLGKIWADRLMSNSMHKHEKELSDIKDKYQSELEKLKIKLKKSEFIFEREFSAASALVEYHEELIPLSLNPEMHMDDVYEDVAHRFSSVEKWLQAFVSKHGAILPSDVAEQLMMAARSAPGTHRVR